MAIFEELLEQIELDEAECPNPPAEWGDGVFEMPFSTAKELIDVVEAAFNLADLWTRDSDGRIDATGTTKDFLRVRCCDLSLRNRQLWVCSSSAANATTSRQHS